MKYLLAALGCIIILSASAQTKAKDQKAFLNALNRLIANTTSQHWAYETPFRIDSAFHIIVDSYNEKQSKIKAEIEASFERLQK
jgi:GTP cyclohydrolase I